MESGARKISVPGGGDCARQGTGEVVRRITNVQPAQEHLNKNETETDGSEAEREKESH